MNPTRPLLAALLALAFAAPAVAQPVDPRPVEDVVEELDAALEKVWAEAGVKPSARAKDYEFLRRLSLDLSGVIPDEATASSFARKRGKDKRARLIQALLHGKDHASWFAHRWANLLAGRDFLMRSRGEGRSPALVRWLQSQIAANTRWDVVARHLISAEGQVSVNGAAQYAARWEGKPEELAGNVMRVFQGQQVQCAQCHDHPYKENWKQKDFWGVAAFFARTQVRREDMMVEVRERDGGEVRIPAPAGQRGPQVEPRFITGESIDPGEGDYRRSELARIVTSANNPYFARATVNRVWSFFFREAFTDPDDMSKPALGDVLDLLVEDFKASRYDLRRLCEVIVSSAAYQMTSTGQAKGKLEQLEVYARKDLRPLAAEQLWWSFERAVGLRATVELWGMGQEAGKARQRLEQLRRGFFGVFGTEEAGAPEEQNLTQALLLLNGPLTNDILAADKNPVVQELLEEQPDARVVRLFLRVLGRPANKAERRALRPRGGSMQEVYHLQDIVWALMNSSEFVYNH